MQGVKQLVIPRSLRLFISPVMTKNRKREDVVIGVDTETFEGRPHTFQFYSEDIPIERIEWPTAENADKVFLRFLDSLPNGNTYSLFAHNLKFDLIEFFYPAWEMIPDEIQWQVGDWTISGVYQRPSFLRLKHPNKTVLLLDSMLWFISSLDAAADMVCPHIPKLDPPKGLGEVKFKKGHSEFEAYAMRDAEVSYHLGKAIQAMHQEFDIPQQVSLASMAAAIFRKDFLTYDIPQPPINAMKAAYNSYHGGKNNVYPGAAPAWHKNVVALDISSAYPYAMAQLPSFGNLKLYKDYKQDIPRARKVPEWGVYKITGMVEPCAWPSLFEHNFEPIQGRFVEDIWVAGHDLNAAIETGEFKPYQKIEGYYYHHHKDRRSRPAFRDYVEHFYKLKSEATNPVQRYTYKILLNSLYGKFIQRREVDISEDPNAKQIVYVAGGLFQPFIATSITAHTRAYIHRLEHRFAAIHTATDGIYTRNSKDLPRRIKASNKAENVEELGKLEVEGKGDLLLLRNKLYVLYTNEPTNKPSNVYPGKYIAKAATHGYQGSLADLERMVATGSREYTITKPNTLKESQRRGLEVNKFETRHMTLNVGRVFDYNKRARGK